MSPRVLLLRRSKMPNGLTTATITNRVPGVVFQYARNSSKGFHTQRALLGFPTTPASPITPAGAVAAASPSDSSKKTITSTQELAEKIGAELELMNKTAAAVSNLLPLMSKKTNTAAVADSVTQAATIKASREAYLRTKYYEGFQEGKYEQKYFEEALEKAMEEVSEEEK